MPSYDIHDGSGNYIGSFNVHDPDPEPSEGGSGYIISLVLGFIIWIIILLIEAYTIDGWVRTLGEDESSGYAFYFGELAVIEVVAIILNARRRSKSK